MKKPKIIEILFIQAGGGHVNAMNALKTELEKQYAAPEWDIRPVNLRDVLEPVDLIHKSTKKLSALRENLEEASPRFRNALRDDSFVPLALKLLAKETHAEDVYNDMLKAGKTDGLNFLLFVLQGYIKLRSRRIGKLLQQRWQQPGNRPELVVSVIPNFNRVIFRALNKLYPDVPYVTVMTDLMDIGKHFWIERQAQFLICGTEEARQQALKLGYRDQRTVFKTSGMILKPDFYHAPDPNFSLPGLAADKKTALVTFGGYGSAAAAGIVDRLNDSNLNLQTIVLCGRNEELYEQLQGKNNCHPVPFTDRVVDYMDAADFMIGKPGPGSLEEARCRGLPVIVLDDSTTMPQERPNIAWIEKHGLGFGVPGFDEIVEDAAMMIENLDIYRANIRKLPPNNALAETVDILGRIMKHIIAPANTNRREPYSFSPRLFKTARKRQFS
jgi:UDP-N-acetylglucosamine:LPS N-acetylglucosamine transferase